MNVEGLAELLRETEEHHGSFESAAPPHNWWDWYAAYMDARQRSSPKDAAAAAARYMAEVKHILVSPSSGLEAAEGLPASGAQAPARASSLGRSSP
jgi:hypothetical protein